MAALDPANRNKTPELGILFVHGIGQQRQGETLIKFADPISRWLARWLTKGEHTEAYVGRPDGAHVRLSEAILKGDEPAHLLMTIDAQPDIRRLGEQTWLLAESWWAETFQPPKTRSLLLWMLLILPYMMLVQFYEQLLRAFRSGGSGFGGFVARLARILVFALLFASALPLAAVMAIVIAVLLIALIIPIPQVSDYAKKGALLLSKTIGDSFVLAGSAVQFDAMVAEVARDLEWLAAKVGHVVVLAHSQGTAVSYAAIDGYENPPNLAAFITVGEAIKKLKLIRGLQTYGGPRPVVQVRESLSKLNPSRSSTGEGRWRPVKRAIGRWFRLKTLRFTFGWVGLAGIFLLTYSIPQLVFISKQQPTHLVLALTLAGIGLLLVGGVGLICHLCWQEDFRSDPEPLQHGSKTIRWADFYASADPVPNGPLFKKTRGKNWLVEKEVWNFASIVRDHTSYTSSEDDFIGCLIGEFYRATGVLLPDSMKTLLKRARWRGWWRVWWLTFARVLTAITAVVTVWRVWGHLPAIGSRIMLWSHRHLHPLRAIGHRLIEALQKVIVVGHPSDQQLIGALAVVTVVSAGYAVTAASWAYWQKQDIKRFYRRVRPEEETDPLGGREFLFFLLVLCLLEVFAIVVGISRDYARPWNWATGYPWLVLTVVAGLLFFPIGLAWLLRAPLRRLEGFLVKALPRDAPQRR